MYIIRLRLNQFEIKSHYVCFNLWKIT